MAKYKIKPREVEITSYDELLPEVDKVKSRFDSLGLSFTNTENENEIWVWNERNVMCAIAEGQYLVTENEYVQSITEEELEKYYEPIKES